MQNVVLTIHLVLAVCLIAVVLLQRSEGGALGIGGGGGGLVSQRGAATALSKITWVLATGFLVTSLTLTLLARGGGSGSVLEGLQSTPAEAPTAEVPAPAPEGDLLPPAASQPAAPQPAAPQPAAEAPSTTPATPSAPAAPKQ